MYTDEETVEWYTPQEVKEGAQNALCIRKRKESNHYLIDYYECYTIHTTVHIELDPTHLMQPVMKKRLSVIDQTGQLRKRGPQHWFLVNNYLKREFIRAKQKTTQLRVNSLQPFSVHCYSAPCFLYIPSWVYIINDLTQLSGMELNQELWDGWYIHESDLHLVISCLT